MKHFWLFGVLVVACVLVQFFYSLGHAPEQSAAKAFALLSAWGMSFLLVVTSSVAFVFLAAQRRHPETRKKMVSPAMLAALVTCWYAFFVISAMSGSILFGIISFGITWIFVLRYALAVQECDVVFPLPRLANGLACLGLCIAVPVCWALLV